ncbi:YgjV family protein [Methylobacterium organophilum]|uniref:YgjV family protein n=1 Tax=Methylobacterium organophilum TaxID=410 RepID=UPI0030844397
MIVFETALPTLTSVTAQIDIFGSLGLCCGFGAGLMPRRSWILRMSALCSACFALHFLRLGALTGTAMCSISVMQSLLSAQFVRDGRRPGWLGPLFALSFLVVMALTAATWAGWPSACAGIGALLATTGRLQTRTAAMRRFFLASSTCWAGHNLLVGSPFGLTCDLLTLSGLALALHRERAVPLAPQLKAA